MAKKFFTKLYENQIKKKDDVCQNLCEFLCIDKKYQKYLMKKKLKKCINDFRASDYFKLLGTNKNKC